MNILYKISFNNNNGYNHDAMVWASNKVEAKVLFLKSVGSLYSARQADFVWRSISSNSFTVDPVFKEEEIPYVWKSSYPINNHKSCESLFRDIEGSLSKKKSEMQNEIAEQAERLDNVLSEKADPLFVCNLIEHGLDESIVSYWKKNIFVIPDRLKFNTILNNKVYVNIDEESKLVWVLLDYYDMDKDVYSAKNMFLDPLIRCKNVRTRSQLSRVFGLANRDKKIIINGERYPEFSLIRKLIIGGLYAEAMPLPLDYNFGRKNDGFIKYGENDTSLFGSVQNTLTGGNDFF